ncbi:glutamine-hydrolyzing GMP synthase [Candidatus Undinarchaeota archaeon]
MDTILVIDFGSQVAHLISRRIRDLHVYSEIVPYTIQFKSLEKKVKELNVKGIILSGGPESVRGGPKIPKEIFKLGIPILGICYGHQLIAHVLNGKVSSSKTREYGYSSLKTKERGKLLKGLKKQEQIWMSHGDTVTKLPPKFKALASTHSIKFAAYEGPNNVYGVQFHPEVRHTPSGMKILDNFISICGAKKAWKLGNFINKKVEELKDEIGDGKVILGLSGGVDSSVAAALLDKAIHNNLHCVFVDNGLVRLGEPEYVRKTFQKYFGFKHFYSVDAKKEFLSKLKGVTDPEKKRKIIAETFIRVFEKKANELERKHGKFDFLAQGTIYPDRIESAEASKASAKIKSHHNVALPKEMNLKVVEPLKDLYKDEVRMVGTKLGLSDELLWRWPFPGPGLGVRCVGEVTEEKLKYLREVDIIVEEELIKAGLQRQIWQAFPAILPAKSVGVMGDTRTYAYIVAIRAVESTDVMTANFSKLDWDLLEKISSRIVNDVRGVNRVLYDITNKPPGTVEYE